MVLTACCIHQALAPSSESGFTRTRRNFTGFPCRSSDRPAMHTPVVAHDVSRPCFVHVFTRRAPTCRFRVLLLLWGDSFRTKKPNSSGQALILFGYCPSASVASRSQYWPAQAIFRTRAAWLGLYGLQTSAVLLASPSHLMQSLLNCKRFFTQK